MQNKKWMARFVNVIEATCWAGIIISSVMAGTFDWRFAILGGAMLLATAGFIWWRVRHDRCSTRNVCDASDTSLEE